MCPHQTSGVPQTESYPVQFEPIMTFVKSEIEHCPYCNLESNQCIRVFLNTATKGLELCAVFNLQPILIEIFFAFYILFKISLAL